jgi:predicted permease
MNEIRLALRSLRRQPAFAITAVLTLALCLGANLLIFAIVDNALLRPLPFPQPQQLVTVYNAYPKAGLDRDGASLRNYFTRRENIAAFASVAAYRHGSEVVGAGEHGDRREVLYITPEFFATLGVQPLLGQVFGDAEMEPQQDRSVVISAAAWEQYFNADPQVLGRSLDVGGSARRVVAVLPADFRYLSSEAKVFLPLVSNAEERAVNALQVGSVQMIARLAPDATVAQAQAQVEADNAVQSRDYPWAEQVAAAGFTVTVAPLHADHIAAIRPSLLLLQLGALCLLLIGAVNLTNLQLTRASARAKETGIRQALGAGRKHLWRQNLTESLCLSMTGGLIGVLIGASGIQALSWFGADQLPLAAHLALDARLVGATLLAALGTGVLIALPVLFFSLRGPVADALQAEARGGSGNQASQSLRHAFIVAQIALAFVLLAGAGLLGVSLRAAMSVSPGFTTKNVLAGHLSLPENAYPDRQARVQAIARLVANGAHLPGQSAFAISTNIPVKGRDSSNDNNVMTVIGHEPEPGVAPTLHYRYGIAGDYFRALDIPLRSGRYLDDGDLAAARRVVVVDEDFARRYWPEGGALGRQLFEGPDARPLEEAFTVVGVVGAVKQTELTDEHRNGAIYFPYVHLAHDSVYLISRGSLDAAGLAPALRALVAAQGPQLAIDGLASMQARIDDTLLARRSPALLAGLFAAAALLLAAIGTYGVLSFAVAQRRREVGTRIALGARPAQIRRQFLWVGLRLLFAGSVLGLIGAWFVGQAMQGFLYGVPGVHPATLGATASILSIVALAACWLPSMRAARISPMTALSDN